jgi:hypothetical protein
MGGVVATVVGAVGALVILGVGTSIQGRYNHDCLTNGAPNGSCSSARYNGDQSTLNAMSVVGDVLIGVAVVGVAAMVFGFVHKAPEHAHSGVQTQFIAGDRSAGVRVTW